MTDTYRTAIPEYEKEPKILNGVFSQFKRSRLARILGQVINDIFIKSRCPLWLHTGFYGFYGFSAAKSFSTQYEIYEIMGKAARFFSEKIFSEK